MGSCLRKIARKFVLSEAKDDFRVIVDAEKVQELLGIIRYRKQDIARKSEVGLVNGLAWTEVGGDVLQVEATLVKGKGELTLTGKLGEVMQESARAALTCVRSRAEKFGIDPRQLPRKGPSYSRSRRSYSERRAECRHYHSYRDGPRR
jgi:ATP-dependent Lon protease